MTDTTPPTTTAPDADSALNDVSDRGRLVVTGATGNVGGAVAAALLNKGREVTTVSRHETTSPQGARHAIADLSDPASLAPALEDAAAVFVVLPPELQVPGATPTTIIDAIAASGVSRVVLLTTIGARTRPHGATRVVVREVEEALRSSDLDWTIVRPGGFMSNAFAWIEPIKTNKMIVAPFVDIAIPVVDPVDIAEMSAACLLDDAHIGKTYEVTGPEAITPTEQAAILGEALGEPIGVHEVSRDEAYAAMSQHVPGELAVDTLDIIGAPSPDEQAVSRDVQLVLGRPANSFQDWVARNIVVFR